MYADIIIDISHGQIDRPFQYRVPDELKDKVDIGREVFVPFGRGNTKRKGYIIELKEQPDYDAKELKEIAGIAERSVDIQEQMIALAAWMRKEYGCTMIQALRAVMPVKEETKKKERMMLCRCENQDQFDAYYEMAVKKKWKSRIRLLEALRQEEQISWNRAAEELHISTDVRTSLEEAGILTVKRETEYRNPLTFYEGAKKADTLILNEEQKQIVETIRKMEERGEKTPCLIHGITGSGKTEVYMALIEQMLKKKKQVIVLIPEISLTYQTVSRFYARFQDAVSMVNSKLSQGERCDQFERARRGEIQIMIGPRSALFTPFPNLGMIVIDEEHENAYKSEQVPRYHARETAIERARIQHAMVVMGSATPSMEAYVRAKEGKYRLFSLHHRAVNGSSLAKVYITDLKKELQEGNRSIFGRQLAEKIEDRLAKKEQCILFLNRRGYSKTVSCRSCGNPVGCPHCAVPLTEHVGMRMVCHYCGYQIITPKQCPTCGSLYLSGFGIGTEKVELLVKERFPQARVLRMDSDTTSQKGGHERILKEFAEHRADILVGTQMIVKGHDFPLVTLVGILAADMSLYGGSFRSQEKTYQLLTQASGRAGRGGRTGEVVIQTYDPDNYCIQAAAAQEYETFFEKEMSFRRLMSYPPQGDMCEVLIASKKDSDAKRWIEKIAILIKKQFRGTIIIIGPTQAPIAKIRDYWRYHMFLKTGIHTEYQKVLELLSELEAECAKEQVYISATAQ